MLLGAHIGPEPTTDRFVVVMVCVKMFHMHYYLYNVWMSLFLHIKFYNCV